MSEEGMDRLICSVVEFREKERTLQLEIEDAVAQICQWAEGLSACDVETTELDSVLARLRGEVGVRLRELADLRGGVTRSFVSAAEVVPIRPYAHAWPDEPREAAKRVALSFDEALDGVGETIAEAFEAYDLELWRALGRKGIL